MSTNGRIETIVANTNDAPAEEVAETPEEVAEVSETPDATETSEEVEETPETPEVAPEDSIDEFLKQTKEGVKKAEWDDKAKEAFKATFGQEDPEAVLQEYHTLKESATLSEQKAKEAEKMLDRIKSMPYEMAKAMEALTHGKDYKGFLKELASGVTLSKPAKDIDKIDLVKKHYGAKFNEEQIESIKAGDADDDLMDRFNDFHALAAEKHDNSRQKEQDAIKAVAEQRKAQEALDKQSALAAVAYAKNDPAVSRLLNKMPADTVDKYLTGELEESLLYNPDGTRSKEGLARLVKASLFDETVSRAIRGAHVAGKTEAKVAQHAKLPKGPAPANGRQPIPAKKDDGKTPNLHPEAHRIFMT